MLRKAILIAIYIVSVSLLSLSIMTASGFTVTTNSPVVKVSDLEVSDLVTPCKAGVLKFVPLGGYPGGYSEVMAALAYCNSLE